MIRPGIGMVPQPPSVPGSVQVAYQPSLRVPMAWQDAVQPVHVVAQIIVLVHGSNQPLPVLLLRHSGTHAEVSHAPVWSRSMPATSRVQSLRYVVASQPQTWSIVRGHVPGSVTQVPAEPGPQVRMSHTLPAGQAAPPEPPHVSPVLHSPSAPRAVPATSRWQSLV